MEPKEPRPSDDPLDFYRSVVSKLIPLVLQLLRAVIEFEKVLSERRRRRIQGLDSIPSEPLSPDEGEEEETEEELSLYSPSVAPSPSTPLPVPSPEHLVFDDQEGEGGERSNKRQRTDADVREDTADADTAGDTRDANAVEDTRDADAVEDTRDAYAADDAQTASERNKQSDSS